MFTNCINHKSHSYMFKDRRIKNEMKKKEIWRRKKKKARITRINNLKIISYLQNKQQRRKNKQIYGSLDEKIKE
jgi:hypothetical protein